MNEAVDIFQSDSVGWTSGHAPMTDAQRVILDLLAAEAGEATPEDNLSQAEASIRIKALRQAVGIRTSDTDTVLGEDDE